jgi:DNA-binding MarR family transcriptional regulator
VAVAPDGRDRRSRVVTMTNSGRHVWQDLALPKIHAYYGQILEDFSVNDVTHTLHYLLKMLENMQRIDAERGAVEESAADDGKS